MKYILTKLIVLAAVLLTLTAAAQIQYSNVFWISTNATGNMYPAGGTLDNPLDGSTQAKFDSNMMQIPPYSTVHILAGTYQTEGMINWEVRSGEKIIGSGMDVTILQMAPGTPSPGSGTFVIASFPAQTNAEVSDLTCDCNYTSGDVTYAGINLDGTENAVRRVRVMNAAWSTIHNTESWGVALSNGSLPTSIGNIIEECEVDPLVYGHAITAISLMGGSNTCISGIVRNNRVFLGGQGDRNEWGMEYALRD